MTTPTVDYSVLDADAIREKIDADSVIPTETETDGTTFDPMAESETRDSVLQFIRGKPRGEKAKRERKVKPPKVVPPKPRPGSLKKPLQDMYGTIGMTVALFDPVCGQAILANAEACAIALENMARENEAVRRVIMSLVQTSIWGQLIAAHMPILLAIAMHHVPALKGMTPFGEPGYPNQETVNTVNDAAANMNWTVTEEESF